MGPLEDEMRRAAAASGEPVSSEPAVAVAEQSQAAAQLTSEVRFDHLDATLAQKVVVDDQMHPASREQYRRLATGLHHAQETNGLKVVMVASAVPGEGKTLTAANLALTLSESYHRRVLIIDADLRRPSLHKLFRIEGFPGLAENLLAVEERDVPLRRISANLSLLTAGKASVDPMAGLASRRMRHIVDEARKSFDWVIVDTPPVGLLSDASLVATNVDGIIFVVRAGSTPYELVKRGVEAIGTDRLLGVVLNRAAMNAHRYGYGYSYYRSYHYRASR